MTGTAPPSLPPRRALNVINGERSPVDLMLSWLREHAESDISKAARLCQLPEPNVGDRFIQLVVQMSRLSVYIRASWMTPESPHSGELLNPCMFVTEFQGPSE